MKAAQGTEHKMEKTKLFWDRFISLQPKLENVDSFSDDKREGILNKLLTNLHAFNSNLYFEFTAPSKHGNGEFIISAYGDKAYFKDADELINSAPNVSGWEFKSLIPRRDENFSLESNGISLQRDETWFLPLENPNHPNIIGLRLALSLGKGHDSRYEFLASKVVESAAGEREYAEHVKIINITSLPEYPEENGYIEMKDLGKYIEWKFPPH